MEPCLTPADFERRATGVMRQEEGDRFDRHLTSCRSCHTAFQSFLQDHRFLAEAKLILGQSVLDETHAVTPTPTAGEVGRSTDTPVLEVASAGGFAPVSRDYLPRIEGYEVIRVLGRGGMGVVYEAVQKKLSRRVALKLLPALVSSAHPDIVTRFKREATAAAKLHHTNIIPIYDFGESRDGYYYAMELIAGQSVSVLIKRLAALDGPLASATTLAAVLHQAEGTGPEAAADAQLADPSSSGIGTSTTGRGRPYYLQVARWIADVADALHYAHLHGLVHRDIKPSNLMICPDGRIVVLDFGLVKGAEDHSVTMTGSLVGTYRYMSPEQVGAKRINVDARTDIYSLGATLYELLSFQPAFGATEQSELLSHILFKDPAPPRKIIPAVPVDLQTICLKALEKAPNARYQTARAMADDLRQYLSDLPIVARPLGIIGRGARFMRRHKTQSLTVVVTVSLVAGALLAKWGWDLRRAAGFYREAVALNQGQDHEAAVRACQRAMELRPGFEEARRLLIEAGNRLPKGGIVSASPASEEAEALMNAGVAAIERDDLVMADQVFSDALRLAPNSFRALVNLATVKKDRFYAGRSAGLLAEADTLVTRALEIEPNRVEAWNLRGIIRRTEGRHAEAIEAHEAARRINKGYYPTWANLGALHATQGDLAESERCLLEATKLPGGDKAVLTWRHLAAVQTQLGRPEAAASAAKALERSGKDVAALLMRARLQLQSPASDPSNEALETAVFADSLIDIEQREAGTAGRPSVLRAWVKRVVALAHLAHHQWPEAVTAAESALQFGDPAPSFARLALAIAESRRGNGDVARRHYAEAVRSWPSDWEAVGFKAQLEGKVLWIDSAAELLRLRREAEALFASSAP